MEQFGFEHGVTLPVRRGGAGGPTKREVSGDAWRRTSHGRYVASTVEPTPSQRVAEAGVLVVPPAAVTGWGALWWMGGTWSTGLRGDGTTRPVPVATSKNRFRPQPLMRICEERFDPREVVLVDGLRITDAVRSTCFAMRYATDVEDAVRVLDMAYFDDLVTPDEVREWALRHPSYTGIDQCRRAVEHGDENAWSPMEVDQRLDWKRVTGHVPLTNRPVFDPSTGRHIGTPDLIDPAAGVVGQYDGGLHLSGERRAADLRRDHDFRAHGLETVTMVAGDRRDPEAYHARLRLACAQAARRPASDHAYTLELPPWWTPTFTVAQRRALTGTQRQRWLGRGAPMAG